MIKNLRAYPSLDSLGRDAITVKASTDGGSYSASVPVNDRQRLLGAFSSIRPNFIGLDELDFKSIDAFLQELIPGEKPLSLAMSLALAGSSSGNDLWKLGAGRDFPLPLVNIISNEDMQEFFIIPHRAKSPEDAADACLEVYNAALGELGKGKLLKGRSLSGSWFCSLDLLGALEFLSAVARDWDLKTGADLHSGPWNGRAYTLRPKTTRRPEKFEPEKYLDFIEEISHTYGIYYLEDPFHKGDLESLSELSGRLKNRLIVGNRLYQSGQEKLERGIKLKSGNGILIMPARAGSISEVLNLSGLARNGGFFPVISQDTRETGDCWLADISILCRAPLLKIGMSGSERLCKLNRLTELWNEVPHARMAGLPLCKGL